LLVTFSATIIIHGDIEKNLKSDFVFSCNEISNKITSRLDAQAQVLRSGVALFRVKDTVTRNEWKTFVEQARFNEDFPGIHGVGFAIIISKKDLQDHIHLIRKEGFKLCLQDIQVIFIVGKMLVGKILFYNVQEHSEHVL
jgi:hypothetical protein